MPLERLRRRRRASRAAATTWGWRRGWCGGRRVPTGLAPGRPDACAAPWCADTRPKPSVVSSSALACSRLAGVSFSESYASCTTPPLPGPPVGPHSTSRTCRGQASAISRDRGGVSNSPRCGAAWGISAPMTLKPANTRRAQPDRRRPGRRGEWSARTGRSPAISRRRSGHAPRPSRPAGRWSARSPGTSSRWGHSSPQGRPGAAASLGLSPGVRATERGRWQGGPRSGRRPLRSLRSAAVPLIGARVSGTYISRIREWRNSVFRS